MEESRYDRSYWLEKDVNFTKRANMNEPQDGRLKADGRPVRMCDGCADPDGHRMWMLMEEFPLNLKNGQWCYYCLDMLKPVKKSQKGEKFSTYREYVNECKGFKVEEENLRSEYREALRRVKSEESVIRAEYAARKKDLLLRKKERDDAYKETARKNF